MKLATKISISIFIVSLLSACFASVFVFISTKQVLQSSVETNQLEITKETMDKLDRFMHEKLQNVSIMAGDESIEHLLLNKDLMDDQTKYDELIHVLQKLSVLTGPWDDLNIITADGIFITEDELNGKSVSDFPETDTAFQKAIRGEAYISDAHKEEDSEYPTMIFALPIKDDKATGSSLGVIHAKLSWPLLLEILKSVNYEKIHLYNSDGFLIGSNKNNDVSKFLVEKDENEMISAEFFQKRLASTIVKEADEEEELITHARSAGFKNYLGKNWALHIETSTEKVFASAAQSALKLALAFIPIILLTSFLIFFILRNQIFIPLSRLSSFVKEISGGNYDSRTNITAKNEIGNIAYALDTMTGEIKKSRQNLESQVVQRTAQLDEKLKELEKINSLMVGRELKMAQLKKEIEELKRKKQSVT